MFEQQNETEMRLLICSLWQEIEQETSIDLNIQGGEEKKNQHETKE